MLDPDEAQAIAERFGVAPAQVSCDHLISHVLAALSEQVGDDVVFFGGMALSRTYIPEGRLSEDIDLLAVAGRGAVAARIEPGLPRALRREFPGVLWRPRLMEVRDSEPAMLQTPDGVGVRVQLLSSTGYAAWPVERRELVQRYSDALPVTLAVPTAAAFVAWKTVAWFDRRAARDLYDLGYSLSMGTFRRMRPSCSPASARRIARRLLRCSANLSTRSGGGATSVVGSVCGFPRPRRGAAPCSRSPISAVRSRPRSDERPALRHRRTCGRRPCSR